MSRKIDIAWMVRTRRAIPGSLVWSSLHWTYGGEPSGSVRYEADMRELDNAELRLSYTNGSGDEREHVNQTIRLSYTRPNYGGRRWWMHCPFRHNRCGKLYLPAWGDRFAGRRAWWLGYQIQRVAQRDRPFERLFRLQRQLGCEAGMGGGLYRPKGMWRRTFERHWERYLELEDGCETEFALMAARLMGRWNS